MRLLLLISVTLLVCACRVGHPVLNSCDCSLPVYIDELELYVSTADLCSPNGLALSDTTIATFKVQSCDGDIEVTVTNRRTGRVYLQGRYAPVAKPFSRYAFTETLDGSAPVVAHIEEYYHPLKTGLWRRFNPVTNETVEVQYRFVLDR